MDTHPAKENCLSRYSGRFSIHLLFMVLALVLACTQIVDAGNRVEIIKLKSRMAADLIPVLQPLLQGQGTITGMRNQLIVKTTPENMAMIRQLVNELDAPLKNLMITVRQGLRRNQKNFDVNARARIPIDNNSGVIVGGGPVGGPGVTGTVRSGDARVRANANQSTSSEDTTATQKVRTLEGKSALIHVSQRIPIQSSTTTYVGPFATRQQNITFQDVTTGVRVLPRLHGDSVSLEIKPQMSRIEGGGINIQEVVTTVSGRLGEWIEIGGVVQTMQSSNNRILGHSNENRGEDRSVQLLVEVVD